MNQNGSLQDTGSVNLSQSIRMRGGDILAAGMQGCVMSPKLKRNGNIAVRSTNKNSRKKVSKVFFDEDVYQREQEILNRVYEVTNGLGVMIHDIDDEEPAFSAAKLNPNNYANLNTKVIRESACRRVKNALNSGQQIYVLNQPKILGDIRKLENDPKPLDFFADAYGGLLLLKKYHIRHHDMFARNIFYDRHGALIGDFGHAVDLDDTSIDFKHYDKSVFQTKSDLFGFFEAIRKYVQLTKEEIDILIEKIKSNDFAYFYELAGIDQDQIPMRVLEYIQENPIDDVYIPKHMKNKIGGKKRNTCRRGLNRKQCSKA